MNEQDQYDNSLEQAQMPNEETDPKAEARKRRIQKGDTISSTVMEVLYCVVTQYLLLCCLYSFSRRSLWGLLFSCLQVLFINHFWIRTAELIPNKLIRLLIDVIGLCLPLILFLTFGYLDIIPVFQKATF